MSGQGHRWVVPGLFALVIVVPVALAVAPAVFSALFDDDRVFSLCPDDRASTQVVSDSRMIADAPEYRGPGPHRLIVDGATSATDGLPADWVPRRGSDGAYRIDQLQLVVCEYRYAVGAEGDLQTCSYAPIGGDQVSTFTAQSAKYDYRVYVVTTNGKMLTSFTLEAVAKGCADFRTIVGEGAQDAEFPASPNYDELKRKLEPLVTTDIPN